MKKNAKKRNTSIGCLFWIALILLVLIVFLFNRERIRTVIEETGFDELVTRQEEPQKHPEVQRTAPDEESDRDQMQPSQEQEQEQPRAGDGEDAEAREPDTSEADDEIRVEEPSESGAEESQEDSAEPRIDKKMRKSTLYFVSVSEDGAISLHRIVRPVYYDSSPLTQTLETLLQGLTSSELNEGLLNLVPEGTAIRRVWVENEVAYIDFSEELKFNPFGTEGLRASLQQIVFTATEFSTVEKVQILIDGSKRSYLATEGIFIGEPLGREDL